MHLFETAAEWINLSGESRSEIKKQEKRNFPAIAASRSCSCDMGVIYGAHLQLPACRHIHHRRRIQPGAPRRVWSLLPVWTPLLYLMDTGLHFTAAVPIPFFCSRFQSCTHLHSAVKIQSNYTKAEMNTTSGVLHGTSKGRNTVFFQKNLSP